MWSPRIVRRCEFLRVCQGFDSRRYYWIKNNWLLVLPKFQETFSYAVLRHIQPSYGCLYLKNIPSVPSSCSDGLSIQPKVFGPRRVRAPLNAGQQNDGSSELRVFAGADSFGHVFWDCFLIACLRIYQTAAGAVFLRNQL